MGASCSQWIACSPMCNGGGGRPLNSVVRAHVTLWRKLLCRNSPHQPRGFDPHLGLLPVRVRTLCFLCASRSSGARDSIESKYAESSRHLNEAPTYPGSVKRSGLRHHLRMAMVKHMRPNNALERSVNHGGRIVLAIDCALADAQWRRWPAAQQDR